MKQALKVLGSYGLALRAARNRGPREIVTFAAPAVVFLVVAAVTGALG